MLIEKTAGIPDSVSLAPHTPIRVNNNTDFSGIANYGNGSSANPWVIANWSISGTGYGYCIYIGNATDHFSLMNNVLLNASGIGTDPYFNESAIIIYNSDNGMIQNNTCAQSYRGIYLFSSNNNTLSQNNISQNSIGMGMSGAFGFHPEYNVSGEADGDGFGTGFCGDIDFDRDGISDFVTGAPFNSAVRGKAYVYSGATGTLIRTFSGQNAGDSFGRVSYAGDLNSDGFGDFGVGAQYFNMPSNSDAGKAYFISGKDFTFIRNITAQDYDQGARFGISLSWAGDADNDSYSDVMIGSPWLDDGSDTDCGSVYVYSVHDGQLLMQFNGTQDDETMGKAVDGTGDIDGDGYNDFIINSINYTNGGDSEAGRLFVKSGRTGVDIYVYTGEDQNNNFGRGAACIGDIDADGFDDFGAGAPNYNNATENKVGKAYIYSGKTGAEKYLYTGEYGGDKLGSAIAGILDVDMDGHDDFAIRSAKFSPNATGLENGKEYIYSGASGGLIYSFVGNPGDRLGAIRSLPNINGDTIPDIALTDAYTSGTVGDPGVIYIYSTIPRFSYWNIICENNISGNSAYGIFLNASTNNNTFYHNNLRGNGVNALDPGNNTWNLTYAFGGGNYWDDYAGVDVNSGAAQNVPPPDQIGDSPHSVSGGANRDMYPLMTSWPPSAAITYRPDIMLEGNLDNAYMAPGAWGAQMNTTFVNRPGYKYYNMTVQNDGTADDWIVASFSNAAYMAPGWAFWVWDTDLGLNVTAGLSGNPLGLTGIGNYTGAYLAPGASRHYSVNFSAPPNTEFGQASVQIVNAYSVGALNDTGTSPVDSLFAGVMVYRVDYLRITDVPNGLAYANQSVSYSLALAGYASAYSNAVGYLGTVSSTWNLSNYAGSGASHTSLAPAANDTLSTGPTVGYVHWRANHSFTDATPLGWDYAVSSPTVNFTIDNLLPLTNLTVGTPKHIAGQTYVNSSTAFNLSVFDPDGVASTWTRIWKNGAWGNRTLYAGNFTVSASDGPVYILYNSTDLLGYDEVPKNVSFIMDNSLPVSTASVGSPAFGTGPTFVTSATAITLSAGDGTGSAIKNFDFRIWDGAAWLPWMPYSAAITFDGTDGSRFIEYNATDNLNQRETAHNLTLRLDNTPPASALTIGAPKYGTSPVTVSPATQFNISATDGTGSGLAVIKISLDGAPWSNYTGTFTVPVAGNHTLSYFATDNLGANESQHDAIFAVDGTAPISGISVGKPNYTADKTYVTSATRFTISATDADAGIQSSWFRVGSGAYTLYTGPFTVSGDGQMTIEYYSVDNMNSAESVKYLTVTVDDSPPTSAISVGLPTYGSNPICVNASTLLTISSADNSSGISAIWYSIGSEPFTQYYAPFRLTGSGLITITFYALDNLGNAEAHRTANIFVDEIAPSSGLSISGSRISGQTTFVTPSSVFFINATDSGSGLKSTWYIAGTGAAKLYGAPFSVAGNGSLNITYYSADNLDNREIARTVQVSVDGTAPSVTVSPAPSGGSLELEETQKITLTASDTGVGGAAIFYSLNGITWVQYTGPFEPGTGTNLSYYAVDSLGNRGATQTVTLNVLEPEPSPETPSEELCSLWWIILIVMALALILLLVLRKRKKPAAPAQAERGVPPTVE